MHVNVDDILLERLGSKDIEPTVEEFRDRKLSPKGWQYKRYGNSDTGERMHNVIKATMESILVANYSARNDSDPRYYIREFFYLPGNVVEVHMAPTRSGAIRNYTIKSYKL